jgi:predicted transposase/invertase (TIGR01784 family)
MLFVKHPNLLKSLISCLLGIPLESIGKITITNPEIAPESIETKFCRLDISMMLNGLLVDLEIQVKDNKDFRDRSLYYSAKLIAGSLDIGEAYEKLPKVIFLGIVDYNLFACEKFHSAFKLLETTRFETMTEKISFHFFELPKLSKNISRHNGLELWLALFKAKTEEDLKKIQGKGSLIMNEAIDAYHSVVSSSEFREMERLREKARHDEAQAIAVAVSKAVSKIEAKLADNEAKLADNEAKLAEKDAKIVKLYAEISTLRAQHDSKKS